MMGMSVNSFAMEKGPSLSAPGQSSAFNRFSQWMQRKYAASKAEIGILWGYASKKFHGQPVTGKERAEAMRVAKKIGISLGILAGIVATIFGMYKLYSKRQEAKSFITAAKEGDIDAVEEFLEKGADINMQNKDGSTALMWAANEGFEEIVKLLLQKGAAVNIQDNAGNTALMVAASKGFKEILKLLLQKGADVNMQNIYKDTPYSFARRNEEIKKMIDEEKYRKKVKEFRPLLGRGTPIEALPRELKGTIFEFVTEKELTPKQKEKLMESKKSN